MTLATRFGGGSSSFSVSALQCVATAIDGKKLETQLETHLLLHLKGSAVTNVD